MAVIFLNGCTSAGKTSIARALQALLPEPHLLLGIDDAVAMLPPRLRNHPDGFFFERDGMGTLRLGFGDIGWSVLVAHQQAAAAIAREAPLILDEVVLTHELRLGWLEALADLEVLSVGVHCSLAELERREKARGDRAIGQARGQIGHVHHGMTYDLEVVTTAMTAEAAAQRIAGAVARGLRPTAFGAMRMQWVA